MNQEMLEQVLEKHDLCLQGKQGGERANLREAGLWEADLWGANLREADLREAILRGADLRGADLRGANLLGADLREADLRGADLREANLWGANLWEADLREADLREANLRGADLWGANLRGANLLGADLMGASLWEANLIAANFQEVRNFDTCDWRVLGADHIEGIDLSVVSTGLKDRLVRFENQLWIGCQKRTIDDWLENYEAIGKANGYTDAEIESYYAFILAMAHTYDVKQRERVD